MKTYFLKSAEGDADPFPFSISRALLHREGFIPHGHAYTELVIIIGGRGIHKTGQAVYPVRRGDIFVIRRGESHGFEDGRQLEMYNLSLDAAFYRGEDFRDNAGVALLFDLEPRFREAGNSDAMFHADPLQMDRIIPLCAVLEEELRLKDQGYKGMFKSLLTQLMILLGRYYTSGEAPSAVRLQRLAAALEEMERDALLNVDLKQLAERHGYSAAHFTRLFRKVYGLSPLQYILQQRLGRAAALLRDGELSISETAWRCGFTDSNYFSRLFRSKMGMSPRDYRKSAGEPRASES